MSVYKTQMSSANINRSLMPIKNDKLLYENIKPIRFINLQLHLYCIYTFPLIDNHSELLNLYDIGTSSWQLFIYVAKEYATHS